MQSMSAYVASGISLAIFGAGVCVFSCSIHSARTGLRAELRNWIWVLLSESLASAGLVFIAIAMSKLEATVVSAISAVQPVFVTVLELALLRDSRPVCSLTGLVLHFVALKILPITGIVVGVVLLTISETAL